MAGEGVQRCVTAVIVPIRMQRLPGPDWQPGPFPNQWTRTRENRQNELIGTSAERLAYINPRLERVLYRRDTHDIRWHKAPVPSSFSPAYYRPKATEVLRLPTARGVNGLLMVHGSIPSRTDGSILDTLKTLANHNPTHGADVRNWLNSQISDWAEINPASRRATFIALVTPARDSLGDRFDTTEHEDWTPADQWLWGLSSLARFEPDRTTLETFRSKQIRPSSKLAAVVSRDSVGLVGLAKDPGVGLAGNFFDGAQFFVEGLYTDALAVAYAQRILIAGLAEAIDSAAASEPTVETLAALEDRVLEFRREYWTTDFAPQGIHDEMILRYREAHDLPERLEQVTRDIADYSRRLQTLATDTTNAVLGFLTIVGLPITIALAGWQGYDDDRRDSLVIVVLLSFAVTALSFVHPTPRRLGRAIVRAAHRK